MSINNIGSKVIDIICLIFVFQYVMLLIVWVSFQNTPSLLQEKSKCPFWT